MTMQRGEEEMQTGQAMVVDNDQGRSITPEMYAEALEGAAAKAKLFTSIVEDNRLYVEMRGRKFLTVEAWLTIAEGYGYTADIEWSRPVEGGGWEARAVVKNTFGEAVAHAEAECATRGDGEWQGRASFQQRSMAQTRAISKALAAKLRWVVVLAKYSPTPADEMLREERPQDEGAMGNCPDHGVPFAHKVGSNARGPYDFWSCSEKDARGRYCQRKPALSPATEQQPPATGRVAPPAGDEELPPHPADG